MKRFAVGLFTASCICAVILLGGCSDKKANPLSAFEPEIITDADAFQFQVTDAADVSTVVSYSWENTSTRVTINHSTATTSGQATVYVLDADSTQVYSSGLVASLNETSAVGATGVWTVRVVFADFTGTANFRIERL